MRRHAAAVFAGMRKNVAHEVDSAPLPSCVEHLGDRGFNAFVGIGDNELDATQPAAGELAQECSPERLGFGRANIHAENLAPAVTIDADRNDDRDRRAINLAEGLLRGR
jgi:hypothetical protein